MPAILPQAHLDPAQQVIVVTSNRWRSRHAILKRFRRVDAGWVQVGRRTPAWLGVNGFAARKNRLQNSGQTPAGMFSLPQAFGSLRQPDVRLPYHRITAHSYWPYDPRDPRTYNVLQTVRRPHARWRNDGQWSERLIDYGKQYRFGVVIGYNLPGSVYRDKSSGERRTIAPARTDKGGGIFLHVAKGRPTAGCVAIGIKQMRRTMQWLDADKSPRIVMGPRSVMRDWRERVGG